MDLPRAGTRRVPIEPDSTGSDDSDGYMSADYASVASTIPNYIYQNGRRYHSTSADKYVRLPVYTYASYYLLSGKDGR